MKNKFNEKLKESYKEQKVIAKAKEEGIEFKEEIYSLATTDEVIKQFNIIEEKMIAVNKRVKELMTPPHEHVFVNGICKECGYECLHEEGYKNGVCITCGTPHKDHKFSKIGICGICGAKCNHEFIEGVCKICGFVDQNYEPPKKEEPIPEIYKTLANSRQVIFDRVFINKINEEVYLPKAFVNVINYIEENSNTDLLFIEQKKDIKYNDLKFIVEDISHYMFGIELIKYLMNNNILTFNGVEFVFASESPHYFVTNDIEKMKFAKKLGYKIITIEELLNEEE